ASIAPAIVESCPTRIFLPNERALEPHHRETYERFGLNPRQVEIMSGATQKRDYYFQSPLGARIFELGLGPVALAFCGSSSPADQKLMDEIVKGGAPFAEQFLARKNLKWAVDILRQWPGAASSLMAAE
ncbi:MAG: conjugal transfer protein TrbE, partial [Amphiplicatus sp.]